MDDNNIRRFDRATRVKTFGQTNAADFAPGSKATTLFLELDPSSSNSRRRRRPAPHPRRQARAHRRPLADFKDIARTARAIKLDEPGFDDSAYRHPATSIESPITTHADSLLNLLEDDTAPWPMAATPRPNSPQAALRAKFIAYELPADFVEDLRADRDALDACNSGKHSDNLEGVESTSAIDTLLSQAQAIITRLDAAIQNKYSRNPDKLAAWKSASRIERAPKKAAAPATPPAGLNQK